MPAGSWARSHHGLHPGASVAATQKVLGLIDRDRHQPRTQAFGIADLVELPPGDGATRPARPPSAMRGSSPTARQTRRISSWYAAMMQRKAVSSPPAADATSSFSCPYASRDIAPTPHSSTRFANCDKGLATPPGATALGQCAGPWSAAAFWDAKPAGIPSCGHVVRPSGRYRCRASWLAVVRGWRPARAHGAWGARRDADLDAMMSPRRDPSACARLHDMLGVKPRSVLRLIADGELPARKDLGRYRILRADVGIRRGLGSVGGRRYAPPQAWGLIVLVSGGSAPWLDRPARRRIEQQLARRPFVELRHALAGRALPRRFAAHPDSIARLRAEPGLMGSGVDAAEVAGGGSSAATTASRPTYARSRSPNWPVATTSTRTSRARSSCGRFRRAPCHSHGCRSHRAWPSRSTCSRTTSRGCAKSAGHSSPGSRRSEGCRPAHRAMLPGHDAWSLVADARRGTQALAVLID